MMSMCRNARLGGGSGRGEGKEGAEVILEEGGGDWDGVSERDIYRQKEGAREKIV